MLNTNTMKQLFCLLTAGALGKSLSFKVQGETTQDIFPPIHVQVTVLCSDGTELTVMPVSTKNHLEIAVTKKGTHFAGTSSTKKIGDVLVADLRSQLGCTDEANIVAFNEPITWIKVANDNGNQDTFRSSKVPDNEIYGQQAYDTYCTAVGGKAFNGDALPDWDTFRKDETKATQSAAWIAVGEFISQRIEG